MLDNPKWKNLIEFTYVGNISDDFNLKILKLLNQNLEKSCRLFYKKATYM